MAVKKIILKQKVDLLGAEADIITVKAGYANNYLLPSGFAIEATAENLTQLEALQQKRVEREAKEKEEAAKVAKKIAGMHGNFVLNSAADSDKTFGAITAIDICKKLAEVAPTLNKSDVILAKPIKQAGDYNVEINLHNDITTNYKITVKVVTQ